MPEIKFKKGDTVMIVESEDHDKDVKKHYGKQLIVERHCIATDGNFYYKVSGVDGWACESDLKKI